MDYFRIKEKNCFYSIEKYIEEYGNYFSYNFSPNKESSLILKNISNICLYTKDFFEKDLYNKLLTFKQSENNTLTVNAFSADYLSFKSREIIKNNPHLFLDSILFIAKDFCFNNIEIYLKWCYKNEIGILLKTIEEAKLKNFIDNINIKITPLEKLTYSKINSIKYLIDIEEAIELLLISCIGLKSSKKLETNYQNGFILASISGSVNNPSLIEIPLSTPLERLLYFTGGMKNEDNIKCIFAGGFFSAPVKKENIKNINIDYKSFRKNKLKLSSGVFFIVSEEICMIRLTLKIIDFAVFISCKKCIPCRTGFIYLRHIIEYILKGTASYDDYNMFLDTCNMIKEGSVCPQIKAIAECIYSTAHMFKEEFIYAIENKRTIYSFYKES